VMVAAKISSTTIFEPGDPLYEPPPSPTPGYLLGGAMLGGGIGLIAYSFGSLPKGPKPETRVSTRQWVQEEMVESTGCGLPGDPSLAHNAPQPQPQPQPAAAGEGDVNARLKKLDQLRASGLITEAEYQRKRKAILDEI
jgi:hypothetical protein